MFNNLRTIKEIRLMPHNSDKAFDLHNKIVVLLCFKEMQV